MQSPHSLESLSEPLLPTNGPEEEIDIGQRHKKEHIYDRNEEQLVESLVPSYQDNENSSTVSNIQDVIQKKKKRKH